MSLYRIFKVFSLNVSEILVLQNPDALQAFSKRHINKHSDLEYCEKQKAAFQKLNEQVDIAISCEPFSFSRVFDYRHVRVIDYENPEVDDENYWTLFEKYAADLTEILTEIGLEEMKKIHSDLCLMIRPLEKNSDIYRILRFTKKNFRLTDVYNEIGGVMHILSAAEIVRRAAEKIFGVELPEEDDATMYSHDSSAVKRSRYRTHRIIDSFAARREFLRRCGLDYTIRLRWYLEGQTEFGAFDELIGDHPNIELINLKGNITAAGNKGLAFAENMQNDVRNAVYSWVTIDNDNKDIVKILLKAVEAKEMFGMFFLSEPDFELDNFTPSELATIVWQWAKDLGETEEEKRENLFSVTQKIESGDAFFKAVSQAIPYQPKIHKGAEWGVRLAQYANKYPNKEDSGKIRNLHREVESAIHSYNTNYQSARRDGEVDVKTGNIIYPKAPPAS